MSLKTGALLILKTFYEEYIKLLFKILLNAKVKVLLTKCLQWFHLPAISETFLFRWRIGHYSYAVWFSHKLVISFVFIFDSYVKYDCCNCTM